MAPWGGYEALSPSRHPLFWIGATLFNVEPHGADIKILLIIKLRHRFPSTLLIHYRRTSSQEEKKWTKRWKVKGSRQIWELDLNLDLFLPQSLHLSFFRHCSIVHCAQLKRGPQNVKNIIMEGRMCTGEKCKWEVERIVNGKTWDEKWTVWNKQVERWSSQVGLHSFLKRCDFWHSLGKKCRNIKTRPSALGRSDSAVESLGIHRNRCPWNPPGRGICIASFGTRVYWFLTVHFIQPDKS